MLCFSLLALLLLSPMPTCPPLCVLLSLVTLLSGPTTRPCPFCLLLLLLFLSLPLYPGGDTWARWSWTSLRGDLLAHWRTDLMGRPLPGWWQAVKASCRFLTLPRPCEQLPYEPLLW